MASIRKRNDKYQAQVRRTGSPPLSRSFTLLKDAQQWARETEIKHDKGELESTALELGDAILRELVVRYQEDVLPHKKSGSYEAIILDAFLRDDICEKKLSKLRTSDFANYREKRLKTISPASLKRQLSPLQNMFEIAREEWGIPLRTNPLSNLKLKATDNRRQRRLAEGELETLLEAGRKTKNPWVVPVVLFALETALRRGEILSLAWDQIDFKRSSAVVLESKNGYSRTIPLSPKAIKILDIMKAYQRNGLGQNGQTGEKRPSNVILLDWSRYILTGHLGKHPEEQQDINSSLDPVSPPSSSSEKVFPITATALRLAWVRLCKRAGIENLHFHDLRHEAISRYFELGLTVPEVASISGHRDLRMLMRYAHASSNSIHKKLGTTGVS